MPEETIEKVASVIAYIEAHLTENLNLDHVAAAVHYSKYHLHRQFTRTVGMTIHDYIWRRKLTEAAKQLVFSPMPVLDIALLAGYESQQAFTDAFTAVYKMPPHTFRQKAEYYPLLLRWDFEDKSRPSGTNAELEAIAFAEEADIPCWMELTRMVIDGFPHLRESAYLKALRRHIHARQALILKDGETAVGAALFSRQTGSIEFMGCHPLYRNRGVSRALLGRILRELPAGREVSTTTFREGDRADTGYREELERLGFVPAEPLVEYGYPTQRFILRRGDDDAQG